MFKMNKLFVPPLIAITIFSIMLIGCGRSYYNSESNYKKSKFIKQKRLISWDASSNFIQVSLERTSKYGKDEIYVWGTPSGRFSGLKVAKVPTKEILNINSYRYFSGRDGQGKPSWSSNEHDAQYIIDTNVGEPCVRYNPYLNKWMLISLRWGNLVLQLADDPWGPFSNAQILANRFQYSKLYNGYMHKRFFDEDGRIVYFLMSQFFPIYNVRVMKVEFDTKRNGLIADNDEVGFLTGHDSINRTTDYGVGGTDLGIMFSYNNKVFFIFGDTFSSHHTKENWRSNTMAFSTDIDASDNIKFDGWIVDRFNFAKEIIPSKKMNGVEMTCIPTAAIAIDSVIYIHYMSVRQWGKPGEWSVNYSSFATSKSFGY